MAKKPPKKKQKLDEKKQTNTLFTYVQKPTPPAASQEASPAPITGGASSSDSSDDDVPIAKPGRKYKFVQKMPVLKTPAVQPTETASSQVSEVVESVPIEEQPTDDKPAVVQQKKPSALENIIDSPDMDWKLFEGKGSVTLQHTRSSNKQKCDIVAMIDIEDPDQEPLHDQDWEDLYQEFLRKFPSPQDPDCESTRRLQEVCDLFIPTELAELIGEKDIELKEKMKKQSSVVRANAAILVICGGLGFCLACYLTTKRDGRAKNSSNRGWGKAGVQIAGVPLSGPEGVLASFRDHCAPSTTKGHIKNVQRLGEKLANLQQDKLKTSFETISASKAQMIAPFFAAVYTAMYLNLPMGHVSDLVTLVRKNGGTVGKYFQSESSARRVAKSIATFVKEDVAKYISEEVESFSLSFDESTNTSRKRCLILAFRSCFKDLPGSTFLDMVEIDGSATGENLFAGVQEGLAKYGIDKKALKKLVSVTTDGATVMTGDDKGLVGRLNRAFGDNKLIVLTCKAHGLELCFNDARKSEPGLDTLIDIIKSIVNVYRNSPTVRGELEAIAESLEYELRAFLLFHEIRWANSFYRVVFNLVRSLPAILEHFRVSLEKVSTKADSKLRGLYCTVASVEFLDGLLFVLEFLGPIAQASLLLQQDGISLVEGHQILFDLRASLIQMHAREFKTWAKRGHTDVETDAAAGQVISNLPADAKTFRVTRFAAAQVTFLRENLMRTGKYLGNTLIKDVKIKRIHFPNLIEKMVGSLTSRLLNSTQQGLVDRLRPFSLGEIDRALNSDYELESLKWLSETTRLVGNYDFVEHQLGLYITENNLAKEGGARPSITEARFADLQRFLDSVRTPSPTSSDVERFFSLMNRIHSVARWSFLSSNVSDLMFVRANGPPPHFFEALKVARNYLSQNEIREYPTKPVSLTPALERRFEYLRRTQPRSMPSLRLEKRQ